MPPPIRPGSRSDEGARRGHERRQRSRWLAARVYSRRSLRRAGAQVRRYSACYNDATGLLATTRPFLAASLACALAGVLVAPAPQAPAFFPSTTSGPAWSASAAPCSPGRRIEEFRAHIIGVLQNVIGPAPRPDPRAARGRAARDDRRHPGHERQPGLHRRPARRRGVVRAGSFPRSRSPASRRSRR